MSVIGKGESSGLLDGQADEVPVSVIVPAYNAESTIGDTIRSILSQDYAGPVELIVADGSDDAKTAERVREVAPDARVVRNPKKTIPDGLNAALQAATASIVVRCDAHARLPPNYLRRAVATLRRTGAGNVGGRQVPVGTSWFARAVALAQTTWLGTGGARHRQGGAEGAVDTVYLGAFRRDALAKIGGFNAECWVNEDYEVNWRLRSQGEVVWFDPALEVIYQPRQSLRALARQYFNYGGGKLTMLRLYPKSVRLRQVAAPALLLGMVASAVLAGSGAVAAALATPVVWLGVLIGGAVVVGLQRRDSSALLLPLVLATIHLSWGSGFLAAALFGARPALGFATRPRAVRSKVCSSQQR